MTTARWVALLVVAGAAWFAVQGGEYSTPQWLALRAKSRSEDAQVRSLLREVDSLDRVRKQLETDPAMQERIARELYGMLRPGEMEYTLIRDDSK